jgi:hypothetical protein
MHQPNTLTSFISQFKRCPKCNNPLQIEATQKYETENKHRFEVFLENDKMKININSSYFVDRDTNRFEFCISVKNGQILYCDKTTQFISLYSLDMLLFKDCRICPRVSPPETFYQAINIFYDRSESLFIATPWKESFSFVYNDDYYFFINDFADKRSLLSVQTMNSLARAPLLQTPFLPFDKFDFKNKEKLFTKMNSIRLLS